MILMYIFVRALSLFCFSLHLLWGIVLGLCHVVGNITVAIILVYITEGKGLCTGTLRTLRVY